MSERESIMPENKAQRKGIEVALQEMDASAKAEQEYVHQELEKGMRPSEILDQLGGREEAARIIGEYFADELATDPEDRELNEWINILEKKGEQ